MRTSRVRLIVAGLVAALSALDTFSPPALAGQRRPGVNMGFYTTTDLLSGDLQAGSVTSSTGRANAPQFAVSVLVTAPLKRLSKRAWIGGLRATPLAFGNTSPCVRVPGTDVCGNGRFDERATLLMGGAFDIRSTIFRAMAGPALYQVHGQGARVGTALLVDWGSPRLRGPTPTVFFTRTFLGSQGGQSAALSTLGVGFRWVRKR